MKNKYPNEHLELRGLRAKNRLRLKDMAKILGITPESYGLKERGMYDFKESEINKILEYFDVKYEDVFLKGVDQGE